MRISAEMLRLAEIQDRKWRGRERHLRQLAGSSIPRRRVRGRLRTLKAVDRDYARKPKVTP